MTNTNELHALANEVAITLPALGQKLHRLANRFGPMEQFIDELAEEARQDEFRRVLEAQGVVILPSAWGRA